MRELNKDREQIVEILNALRTCIDRRHYTLYKKIAGGLGCDTRENFKLSIIAYLLIQYQKNKETCLENNSSREGWKIVNVFVDYVTRECRECLKQYSSDPIGYPTLSGLPPPPGSLPPTFYLQTKASEPLTTLSGDNLIHNG